MNNPIRVGVVGGSGFLGAELIRLLAHRDDVVISALAGRSSAGQSLSELRENFVGVSLPQIMAVDPGELANACDVVFLAVPHGQSAAVAAPLVKRGCPVIDLGSDFRLRNPRDYTTYYGREAPPQSTLDKAVYVLPELTGPPEPTLALIACPGCFATGLALTITPLAPHLKDGARVNVAGVTGSSGSGIQPTERVHHSLRSSNYAAYKVLTHQHMGEVLQLIETQSGRRPRIDFVPHSGPFTRGIHLTTTVRADEIEADPRDLLSKAYENAELVSVKEGPVSMASVVGSCAVQIGVIATPDVIVLVTVLDNLLKGGAGQAIQNFNLRMGFAECAGLPRAGTWP